MERLLPSRIRPLLAAAALCGLLAACNVGYVGVGSIGSDFSVGGTVSGLPVGQPVVLLNNGRDSLTIASNGTFVFGGLLPYNSSYLVTISTQPASADCVVTNGSGTVNGDVNNVLVTCQAR
ncbi:MULTISPECIES: DUF4369 domain-containing protein [Ralstonia]|uniref:DUF4369 domain-containing protein n=1 Tax=Ralstonia TaxID=48736 RepID=UPI000C79B843|nr:MULTISPECIES: DUF4369 domain-containing protein [Ralstonia]PLT16239.1 hypothetical protein CXP34_18985 [Ralstonia mannitolilytica]